jgi:hypothetical protein
MTSALNFSPKPEGKSHLGDVGVNSKIILRRMLRRQGVRFWTGFTLQLEAAWLSYHIIKRHHTSEGHGLNLRFILVNIMSNDGLR